MKSYIIKIELKDSNTLIWRGVVMPAGATFNRLYDIFQGVTNFQSGYPCIRPWTDMCQVLKAESELG